jgi:hypothetical protein
MKALAALFEYSVYGAPAGRASRCCERLDVSGTAAAQKRAFLDLMGQTQRAYMRKRQIGNLPDSAAPCAGQVTQYSC